MQELLLEATEQHLLRQLDVQFAIMVAGEQPAVMLAAAILSRDAGEGMCVCRFHDWSVMIKLRPRCNPVLLCWATTWTGNAFCSVHPPSVTVRHLLR
jgi:hypothetical protein